MRNNGHPRKRDVDVPGIKAAQGALVWALTAGIVATIGLIVVGISRLAFGW